MNTAVPRPYYPDPNSDRYLWCALSPSGDMSMPVQTYTDCMKLIAAAEKEANKPSVITAPRRVDLRRTELYVPTGHGFSGVTDWAQEFAQVSA